MLPQSVLMQLLVRESSQLLKPFHAGAQVSVLGFADEKNMQMVGHEAVRRKREPKKRTTLSYLDESTRDNRFIREDSLPRIGAGAHEISLITGVNESV